jgi:hypothetical protein
VIDVTMWRDASGEERLDIDLPHFRSCENIPQSAALNSNWYRKLKWRSSISGTDELRVFSRNEPVELLRMRFDGGGLDDAPDKRPQAGQGLMIWFEELKSDS